MLQPASVRSLIGTLALLLSRDFKRRWQRWLLVGPAFALAGLIGVSRVYLGATRVVSADLAEGS